MRFSSKELARALVGADLSEEQQKVFVKAYANSINDDMEITPEALRIVMERARFSKDQALKFKMPCLPNGEIRKRRKTNIRIWNITGQPPTMQTSVMLSLQTAEC